MRNEKLKTFSGRFLAELCRSSLVFAEKEKLYFYLGKYFRHDSKVHHHRNKIFPEVLFITSLSSANCLFKSNWIRKSTCICSSVTDEFAGGDECYWNSWGFYWNVTMVPGKYEFNCSNAVTQSVMCKFNENEHFQKQLKKLLNAMQTASGIQIFKGL